MLANRLTDALQMPDEHPVIRTARFTSAEPALLADGDSPRQASAAYGFERFSSPIVVAGPWPGMTSVSSG